MITTRTLVVRCLVVLTAFASGWFAGCKREERSFRVSSPAATRAESGVRLTGLQPGMSTPPRPMKNDYEENAYGMAEGARLFVAFNCNGCHARGGGAIGPALIDEKWRYGSEPEQIFATIMEGRPNGMPSFRGKIPEHQAWQIAAYVRSLSGFVPIDAAPSRTDHIKASPPPNSVDPIRRPAKDHVPQPR